MSHEGCTEAHTDRETHSHCQATTEHIEALDRVTDILMTLKDILYQTDEWSPFWVILRHINNDLQLVNNQVQREVPDPQSTSRMKSSSS